MKQYPCFFMVPNNSKAGRGESPGSKAGRGESAAWARDEVEDVVKTYRIDTNRIYIIGASYVGGSGTFEFANLYYEKHGRGVAGIVRLSGHGQTELRGPLADKTSVWYHVGTYDDMLGVRTAEETYQAIKAYAGNASAVESTTSDFVGSLPRRTKTLTKNGIVIAGKSEYDGMGPDAWIPFRDPRVLEWLVSQSLENR